MFVIKPPIFLNDEPDYHRRRRYTRKYDRLHFPGHETGNNSDLRLIILRHGERIDQLLGSDWFEKIFGNGQPISPQAYYHPSLPRRLPQRNNGLLYVFDPPLTRNGENTAYAKGQELAQMGTSVDYCYSSPACRSVLTASAILHAMNRSHVPIRIEPNLFEPMNWNTPLRMLEQVSPFMSTGDWIQTGYNIDRRYHRLGNYLNPYETVQDYYMRSQAVFSSIEDRHGASNGHRGVRRTNILMIGHASTTVIFPTIAQRQPFDAETMGQQCAHAPFLHTVILDRDASSHIWFVRPIMAY